MRILVSIQSNKFHGISARAVSVANKLRSKGVETHFLLPKIRGELAESIKRDGFVVHQLTMGVPSQKSITRNIHWLFTFPLTVITIIRIIINNSIDIIHTNGLLNIQAPVAALFIRRKIVWHLANTFYPRIVVNIMMPFIRRTSHVVPISRKVSEYFCSAAEDGPGRSIIHEPVEIQKYDPSLYTEEVKNSIRDEFDITNESITFCTVANIGPPKGYEYLLIAASEVIKLNRFIKFIIIGSVFDSQKEYYNKIMDMIKRLGLTDSVKYVGMREDIPECLSVADVFLLPSLFEGTPVAIMEAMSMKLPVIATRVGGIPDIIDDGVTGLLVPPKDTKKLEKAIFKLCDNIALRKEMGAKGRKRVKALFSLDQCVDNHFDLYHKIYSE